MDDEYFVKYTTMEFSYGILGHHGRRIKSIAEINGDSSVTKTAPSEWQKEVLQSQRPLLKNDKRRFFNHKDRSIRMANGDYTVTKTAPSVRQIGILICAKNSLFKEIIPKGAWIAVGFLTNSGPGIDGCKNGPNGVLNNWVDTWVRIRSQCKCLLRNHDPFYVSRMSLIKVFG